MTDKIKLFEQKQIRTHWDAENDKKALDVTDANFQLLEEGNDA